MKRSMVILALLLGLAASGRAQVQGGTIGGTVRDEQGGVLPGVMVTLQGVDATRETVTGADGGFRFLDLAPGPYQLTAALPGFSTIVQDKIVVAVGKAVDLRLTTKIAGITETITVSGGAPTIDTRATGTASNVTSDERAKIPTSRDPFALMRTVPGVLVDRVADQDIKQPTGGLGVNLVVKRPIAVTEVPLEGPAMASAGDHAVSASLIVG
jgi:hypothetical protein